MQVPIGEMREPVSILSPTRTADASGGEIITYDESDQLFVSVRALSTTEAVQFGQVNSDISHVCFGHYESLSQLKSTDRIKLLETGDEFDINGSPINDPKRAWTRLNLMLRDNG
jgi:head-tail adaptor